MKVKRKGSTWLRVQREVVALLGMMPQRPSHFRPNCVNVWTPGQLNRATNRHAPKPSFGLSSGGLKRFIEGSRPRTEPRKHPKWPPGRWTVSVIRQQPRKNANFASGDLSKDRKSSETFARNRVMIDSDGRDVQPVGVKSFAKTRTPPESEVAGEVSGTLIWWLYGELSSLRRRYVTQPSTSKIPVASSHRMPCVARPRQKSSTWPTRAPALQDFRSQTSSLAAELVVGRSRDILYTPPKGSAMFPCEEANDQR